MNIEKLKELVAAATPGPWVANNGGFGSDDGCVGVVGSDKIDEVAVCGIADAALIVAAVNALPSLIARLEAAEKVVEAAKMMHPVNRSDRLQSALTTYDQEKAK